MAGGAPLWLREHCRGGEHCRGWESTAVAGAFQLTTMERQDALWQEVKLPDIKCVCAACKVGVEKLLNLCICQLHCLENCIMIVFISLACL